MNVSVIGGQIHYKNLTSKLEEQEYAVGKTLIWINMLNRKMKPVKWLKPNKKGTKINFQAIMSQADYDAGLYELNQFLQQINEKYGTNLQITTNNEETPLTKDSVPKNQKTH